jgi:hypothetical protein
MPGMLPGSNSKGFTSFEVTRTVGACKWTRIYHHDHDTPNVRKETRLTNNVVRDIRVFEAGTKTYPWSIKPAMKECANENGQCTCTGKVAYGKEVNGKLYFDVKDSTGTIGCNNTAFKDPIVGEVKKCFCSPSATANGGKPIGKGRRMLRGAKRAARDNLCAIYMRHIFNMAKKSKN